MSNKTRDSKKYDIASKKDICLIDIETKIKCSITVEYMDVITPTI